MKSIPITFVDGTKYLLSLNDQLSAATLTEIIEKVCNVDEIIKTGEGDINIRVWNTLILEACIPTDDKITDVSTFLKKVGIGTLGEVMDAISSIYTPQKVIITLQKGFGLQHLTDQKRGDRGMSATKDQRGKKPSKKSTVP